MADAAKVKCVLIGDGDVGKTSLLTVFITGVFPGDCYMPTIIDNQCGKTEHEGHTVCLDIWDTAGQEEYDVLRKASYPGTQVFLVCFTVDRRSSYENVANWLAEVRTECPDAASILVAMKTDLRSNATTLADFATRKEAPISRAEGEHLARRLGFVRYTECSARDGVGVQEVFVQAVAAHFEWERRRISRPVRPRRKICRLH